MTTSYAPLFIGGKGAKSIYTKRRQALARTLGHPVIIHGVTSGPGDAHPWASVYQPIYQNPALLYLTGINQPNVELYLAPSGDATLFLPKYDAGHAFWEGRQFAVGNPNSELACQKLTGIKALRCIDEFWPTVCRELKKKSIKTVGTFWCQSKNRRRVIRDSAYTFSRQLKRVIRQNQLDVSLHNIDAELWPQQLVLDKLDINATHEANQKTREAFVATLSQLSTLKSETEVNGVLQGELLRQTCYGLSFPPIVASGQNAATLHYNQNNAPLNKGELLLLDFGLRYQTGLSDISRTVPVSGRFNPLQALVYDIVLGAQAQVEAHVRSGVTIAELNHLCWAFIEAQLDTQVCAHGGVITRDYDKQPHNVSHLIGLQVHDGDPFREYRNTPLVAGNLISNEPGFYGHITMTIDGQNYSEHLGIRIEDNVLVTKTGCTNISELIPKTRGEIEKTLACY